MSENTTEGGQQLLDEAQRIITVRQLLEAGVHFGHRTERWNPKMRTYIFGARNGVHIIDLQQTATLMRRAYAYIRSVAAEGQPILFVGTKRQAQDVLISEAQRCGQFFVVARWLGGTLTNWKTIRQSVDKLRHIEKMSEDGTYEKLTKKEVLQFERSRAKLERNLGGIKDMPKLPGAIFVIDPNREHIAVSEANRLGVPVVALADTNADPSKIQYIIPGNDDAIRSIKLITSRIADAAAEGNKLGKQRAVDHGDGDNAPAPIRVTTGGDGPKVELVSRRTQLPTPEAAATPETESKAPPTNS
ncbi:ribosomal protein S2 [Plesiocystis pacifica SIR-1]|uniref:Small ribosomal subunit protein uS2 n=1 Tax=Plesiocystis pacifica SIR-1 TaxID=391625 RepID=A6GAK0_9BACT|nr:30S ribosomal protein S2 [Plesiocystis pacifica]EDM77062.1 ribosomal protein S2 [Plesiocystis pacifica SIR-1]